MQHRSLKIFPPIFGLENLLDEKEYVHTFIERCLADICPGIHFVSTRVEEQNIRLEEKNTTLENNYIVLEKNYSGIRRLKENHFLDALKHLYNPSLSSFPHSLFQSSSLGFDRMYAFSIILYITTSSWSRYLHTFQKQVQIDHATVVTDVVNENIRM